MMITRIVRTLFVKVRKNKKYAVAAAFIALFSALLYYSTGKQEFDGVRINLAGRQRMLSQKLTKDILLYQLNKISPRDISRTVGVFDKSLHALTYGGWTQPDLSAEVFQKIPRMRREPVRDSLVSLAEFWGQFRVHVERFVKSRDAASFDYIIAHNEKLLQQTDRVVMLMQEMSERNALETRIGIAAAIALVVLMLSFNLYMKVSQLRKVKTQIAGLEKLLPICSNCKRIREKDGNPQEQSSWTSIEAYLRDERNIMVTHGLCPDCTKKLYPDFYESQSMEGAGK